MSNILKPLGNRILVKPNNVTTVNGIYIPDSDNKTIKEATVIEISNEVNNINKGDIVIYHGSYATILDDGNAIVQVSNIMAKYENTAQPKLPF
jgi:co-chaperonin GroES (HSP10)